MRPIHLLGGVLLAAAGIAMAGSAPPGPPPAGDVVDSYQGIRVPDPFRALEDLQAPATQEWLGRQGAWARERLDAIPGRAALAARIDQLSSAAGDQLGRVVPLADGIVFYLKRERGEGQFKLLMRPRAEAAERLLFDPNARVAPGGPPLSIDGFEPSWDGRYVAFTLAEGGSERAALHVLDVARGQEVITPVPRIGTGSLSWLPDSRSVAFNQLRALEPGAASTETYLDPTVMTLRVDEAGATPRPVFGRLLQPGLGLQRLDNGSLLFHPGSPYVVARTTDTTLPQGRLFVARVSELSGPASRIRWQRVATASDEIVQVVLRERSMLLRSRKNAPNGRILELDLAQPSLAKARVRVPEAADRVITGMQPAAHHGLWVSVQQGFTVRTLRWDGERFVDGASQLDGSLGLAVDASGRGETSFLFQSRWTEPLKVWVRSSEGAAWQPAGLHRSDSVPGLPRLVAREVMVPSHDGTMVPLAVVHREGLVLDGRNPTLLTGYAAYGYSIRSGFSPTEVAWFERGGVIARVNARGSGALGDRWYRAGFKSTKRNTWLDGIAAAQWLVREGYTTPQRLGVWGTSAGGIFVGRAVTASPQSFAAAIFDVGVMDTVRAELSANGITNIGEFGSAKNAAEFPALLEMSTYHQIRDGVRYPAVMLIHGMNDPRVDVWHSAKVAARLLQANPGGAPVLLRLDRQAGHGIGSSRRQRGDMQADAYAFMLQAFGMEDRIGASAP